MLTCLYGRAGAGKTTYVLSRAARAESAREKAILIVPEQFTFRAERLLLSSARTDCLFFTQVLSPQRLAHRVFQAVGGLRERALDQSGMAMAATRAIAQSRNGLAYYTRMTDSPGFSRLVRDMILAFQRGELAPGDLKRLADARTDALGDKLRDIAIIYETYLSQTDGAYADPARRESALIDNLSRAAFLYDSDVYVDGFDIIEPLTLRMLATLATVAKNVTVTFTADDNGRDDGLFKPVNDTMRRLAAMARDMGAGVTIAKRQREAYAKPAIAHMESELFAVTPLPYAADAPEITLLRAPGAEQEAMLVSAHIARLIREHGYAAGDIAVVCSEMEERPRALCRWLSLRGIEPRYERMQSALCHGAAQLIIAALEAAGMGGYGEPVRRVIKSGFAGITDDEADALENIIIQNGPYALRPGRPMPSDGLSAARDRVTEPLAKLAADIRRAGCARDYATATYAYISASGVLEALAEGGENQLAQTICDVLDQSYALLGELSARAYAMALKDGFSSKELGQIPDAQDAVAISSLGRFKGSRLRALFVMGVNDGLLPKSDAPEMLLTDAETDALGIPACGGARQFAARERLTLYGAVTEPCDRLFFSWATRDGAGAEISPSHIIGRIRAIFPMVSPCDMDDWHDARLQMSNDAFIKRSLGLMLRSSSDPAWAMALAHYEREEPLFAEKLRGLYGFDARARSIGPGGSLTAYGHTVSVSRLELFAACPYAHFLAYALRPVLLSEPRIRPLDAGIFFHNALDVFTAEAARVGFDTLDARGARALMERVAGGLCDELISGPVGQSAVERHNAGRLATVAVTAAEAVLRQIRNSAFVPVSSEARFGDGGRYPALEIPAGGLTLKVVGRIDRLDMADIGGEAYARVIDYKTGGAHIRFADIYEGVNQQLLTYLAAVSGATGARGAGAYYFKIRGETVSLSAGEPMDYDSVYARRQKGYRLEGLGLSDPAVLAAMCLDGRFSENIGVQVTKSGVPYGNAPVLDAGGFAAVAGFLRKKQAELGRRMRLGDISADPLIDRNRKAACQTCPMRRACMYEDAPRSFARRALLSESAAKERVLKGGLRDG